MWRKSLAKYRIAPNANSPNEGLNTPAPLVSGTELSTSSGNSVLSRPTERECTQRKLGHIPNTLLQRGREPDQLKNTVARAAACSNASTESPTIISTPAGGFFSIASCGSDGSARTSTVSFSIGFGFAAQKITPQCKPTMRGKRALEKSKPVFSA